MTSRRRYRPPLTDEQMDLSAQLAECTVAVALLRSLIAQGAVDIVVQYDGVSRHLDCREAMSVNLNGATIDIWCCDPPSPDETLIEMEESGHA